MAYAEEAPAPEAERPVATPADNAQDKDKKDEGQEPRGPKHRKEDPAEEDSPKDADRDAETPGRPQGGAQEDRRENWDVGEDEPGTPDDRAAERGAEDQENPAPAPDEGRDGDQDDPAPGDERERDQEDKRIVAEDKTAEIQQGSKATIDIAGDNKDVQVSIVGPTTVDQGTWSVDNGKITFTSAKDFVGDVSTPYRVTNPDGTTSEARIKVTVKPKEQIEPERPGQPGQPERPGQPGQPERPGQPEQPEQGQDQPQVVPGGQATPTPGNGDGARQTPNPQPGGSPADVNATNPVPQLSVPQSPSRGADPSAALNTGGSPAQRSNPGGASERSRGSAPASPNPLALGTVNRPSAPEQDPDPTTPRPASPSATPRPSTTAGPRKSPSASSSPAPSKTPVTSDQDDARASGGHKESDDGEGWGLWPWIITPLALGGTGAAVAAGVASRKRHTTRTGI